MKIKELPPAELWTWRIEFNESQQCFHMLAKGISRDPGENTHGWQTIADDVDNGTCGRFSLITRLCYESDKKITMEDAKMVWEIFKETEENMDYDRQRQI